MISFELLSDLGILIITPEGKLASEDFHRLSEAVDPYIEQHSNLNGLMIYAKNFPGWENFGALISHVKFIKDHHEKIQKVAAVTDAKFVSMLPNVVDHFVQAKVRHFDYEQKDAALNWLSS